MKSHNNSINRLGIFLFTLIIFSCTGRRSNEELAARAKALDDSILMANDINDSNKEAENHTDENTNNISNNSQGNSNVAVSESITISNQIKQDIVSFRIAADDLSGEYLKFKNEYERYGDHEKLYYLAIQYKGRAIRMLSEIKNYKNFYDRELNNDQRFDLEMLLAGTGVLELTLQSCEGAISAF